ncbi:MAG: sulfotransferase domain-containing protein [Pseudomonadales bacterium]
MLILVYGLPKSASTFAAELCRDLARAAGHDQEALREKYLGPDSGGGYVSNLPSLVELAGRMARDDLLVLKTHSPRMPELAALEADGVLRTLVTYRDPRDAALSAFEAGKKARESGDQSQGFYRLETLDDAIGFIARHINKVTRSWLLAPHALKLQYGYLTRSPLHAAADIARFIGLDDPAIVDAAKELANGEKRVYNFNVGQIGRYKDVFSPAQLAMVTESLADYLAFCAGRKDELKDCVVPDAEQASNPLSKNTEPL